MKDILIISHFMDFPWEKGNDRFIYIANMLVNCGYNVELLTSDFHHVEKRYHEKRKEEIDKIPYRITFIHEPEYCGNISLKRIYSHHYLGRKLKKYLLNRDIPDLIYCGIPSLSIASEAARYAKKNGCRFIIDIQDLWPEAFKMAFHPPILTPILYAPLARTADDIYESATGIIAVSETYLQRGKKNNDCKGYSVFLGTDLEEFDLYKESLTVKKPEGEIWIAYVGTLGHSYDLTFVIRAIGLIRDITIKLIVLGDGPLKEKFEEQASQNGINSLFLGRLKYSEMVSYLCQCDIAVNPIMEGAAQSIINKVGDYAAAGLPVINTQESEEYRKLISQYNCGINCDNRDVEKLSEAIKKIGENKEMRIQMGRQNRLLAETLFDRKSSYETIINVIQENLR